MISALAKHALFLSLAMLAFPLRVYAFPEMIRHGYSNCTSCHVSPSGGGVLTAYGRELSKELLSTWSSENEHQPLHGLIKELPENLMIGGDLRWIQTRKESSALKQGNFFFMQGDLEAAVSSGPVTLDASIGLDPGSPFDSNDEKWVSRRHFVIVQTKAGSFRAGRFTKNFGIMIPDHTAQIRRGLGWDQGSETYNLEYSKQMEADSFNITLITDYKNDESSSKEKAVSASYSHTFAQSLKLGSSVYQGQTSEDTSRSIYGVYWNFGLTEKLYLLGELDLVDSRTKDKPLPKSTVSYGKVGYEIFKGFDLYALAEQRDFDIGKGGSDYQSGGFGFQWSPRPHFILTSQWQEIRANSSGTGRSSSGWFIFQYAI